MIKTLVLICAPLMDPSACTKATALDIVHLPQTPGTMCPMGALSSITELELKDGRYPKIVCERPR